MNQDEPIGATKGRLLIVTGVSGAGRATAMRVLEDLGFYCVDNLPVALAPVVTQLAAESDPKLHGVALGIDSRERLFFPEWPRFLSDIEQSGTRPQILFLDASDDVLARRYSETRRPHPLAEDGATTMAEAIRAERLKLAEIRERADRVIDTTTLTVHELRELVTAMVMGSSSSKMSIAIVSFGYKYGLPVGMDLVLDVRFIPNPFFVPELRALTGADQPVHDYVMAQAEAVHFADEITDMLSFLLPLYQREGKSYLTIGLGCTGGRHRSPVLARELAARLKAAGYEASVRDQDIAK
jgi:RNase adapter protein RapZ